MEEYLKGNILANKKVFTVALVIIFLAIVAFAIFLAAFQRGSYDYYSSKYRVKNNMEKSSLSKGTENSNQSVKTDDSQEIRKTLNELSNENVGGDKHGSTVTQNGTNQSPEVINEMSVVKEETDTDDNSEAGAESPEEINNVLNELNNVQ